MWKLRIRKIKKDTIKLSITLFGSWYKFIFVKESNVRNTNCIGSQTVDTKMVCTIDKEGRIYVHAEIMVQFDSLFYPKSDLSAKSQETIEIESSKTTFRAA